MYKVHDFIFERSLDYLNWRYCDVRGGDYYVLQAKKESEYIGYLVCRIVKKEDSLRGYIVDVLVDPAFPEAGVLLLERGLEYFDEHGVNMCQAWVTKSHWFEDVFTWCGLVDTRRTVGIFLNRKEFPDKETMLKAPSNRLHLQMGDTDWI
jgi:hypothetical protein